MSQVTPCCTPIVIPGPRGPRGPNPVQGTDGHDAFTELSATLTMPVELGSVTANVLDSSWAIIGLKVWVGTLGTMLITAIPSATQITLQNMMDTTTDVYMDNAAPGTIAGATTLVIPTGGQGPPGVLAGISGGDLEGNYPNPTLAITSQIGDLVCNSGAAVAPRNTRLAMGTATRVLHAQVAGVMPAYQAIDLSGTGTALSGQLGLGSGGTGYNAATVAALIKHLMPLTTKGDIACYDGSVVQRMPAGLDGLLLAADSTAATGLRYVAPATGSSFLRSVASVSPFAVPLATSLVGVTTLPMTVQLAAGAGYGSKVIIVKDEVGTAATDNITITPGGGQLIEGSVSYVININRGVARIYFNGTEWKIC